MSDRYRIRIKGHFDPDWAAEFNDLSLRHLDDGITLLTGPVADQAALHGILTQIPDMGLSLLMVQQDGPKDKKR